MYLDEVQLAKEWLKTDGLNASFDEIIIKWEFTYDIRHNEIEFCLNLSDIFESWPILKNARGYELVSIICYMFILYLYFYYFLII